ncbi:3-ketoacyl-CoA synthase 7 [Diospyros lotus]|uniref:3-ketoacyl-CoA synthase 7 n=1 Tax=Diospyros lotus TaxID=55363 RepID=UPI00225A5D5A|nr:3-ketoacyl-CoA synthase 7 [Diospyros lotus]
MDPSSSITIRDALCSLATHHHLAAAAAMAALIMLAAYCFCTDPNCVYLIDFCCYLPPDHLRVPIAHFIEQSELNEFLQRDATDFQQKVSTKSGIGSESCMPLAAHEIPPDLSLKSSLEETETVLFTVVDELLSKHDVSPNSIDVLVSNCSLFCPTPSITARIVNRFGFRSDVKSVSLGGMGCSAGLLSVSLAKDLLKVHNNSTALVLSMEVITPNGYLGKNKSMLLANTLFRMGGVALLLSNKKRDRPRAKYKLQHLVRTHLGSDDQAYQSVVQEPDESGRVGVSLSRDLLGAAGHALRKNISRLGPLVLPYSEQLKYGWSLLMRRELYVPDFKKAFAHFCIHAGGKAVIAAAESSLRLRKEDTEASRMTLYRFGNTSSSSVWYELCYLEAKGSVKKGDQVWQIAFGSGFKCNSAVWKCIWKLDDDDDDDDAAQMQGHGVRNAWSDRIHLYPVEIPRVFDH